ncbi:TetR family transcriptional regulator [Kitasatospora sp. NPDC059463]|uniref:TetR family transcriptional regulator n=1 Tax=unclassified Kitasatospora TaxID=2633591 RepID=UPI00368DE68A
MARTSAGHETRERLLRAAEELFATRGVEASLTKDIVRQAGQSNPSAVQYHFGSREGLLDAIMAARQERTERALAPRLPALADADLPALLGALIAAEATELRTEQGRRCLLISAQISRNSGVRTRTPHPTLAGGGYWRIIELAEERISALPEPIRLERLDLVLTLIGAALADRAQQYLGGSVPLTDEETFLTDLAAVSAAVLSTPSPSPTSRRSAS